MLSIRNLVLTLLLSSSTVGAQITTATIESGLFQIIGTELSSGSYNSIGLGFDVKKVKAAVGFSSIQTSYSETDYNFIELYSSGEYAFFQKNRFIISAGTTLAFKVLRQQRFMNVTQKSFVNPLDTRLFIDISYKGQMVTPYLRGYRGLLNLETSEPEYFFNQQIALGLELQLDNLDDE